MFAQCPHFILLRFSAQILLHKYTRICNQCYQVTWLPFPSLPLPIDLALFLQFTATSLPGSVSPVQPGSVYPVLPAYLALFSSFTSLFCFSNFTNLLCFSNFTRLSDSVSQVYHYQNTWLRFFSLTGSVFPMITIYLAQGALTWPRYSSLPELGIKEKNLLQLTWPRFSSA